VGADVPRVVEAPDRRPGLAVRLLLGATLLELFLLGSGRLIQIGPLTLRMWLFGFCLGSAALFVLLGRRLHREVVVVVLAFLALTTLSAMIGLLNHAPMPQLVEDVKPLLFFLSLPFFALAIRDERQVATIARLIKLASLLLAAGYLLVLALIYAGFIPFEAVYALLSQSSEFFFRGDTGIFYKGFLYLGIGLCFFFPTRGAAAKLASLFLLVAILGTLTRGLLLSAGLVLALTILLQRRSLLRVQLFLVLFVAGSAAAWPWLLRAFGSRAESDEVRLYDARVVERSADAGSFLVGHGLGTSIGERARIEASYLEIFHQQGIIGLAFWLVVLLLITRDYWNATQRGAGAQALPYFLGALYVYLESATNPFLTNPIGMSMVLLSLVVLRLLAEPPGAAPRGSARPAPAR
jgi:hypothetical protein